ncbi:MAG: NAD(P)/FAD-dependent oxidoreductase [Kofleriaceae bacterium]
MRRDVVILGAGHSGLAMSRCLTERSIDHVVLERGQVANSWKTERWESLRLLTPNWQNRLPGHAYTGPAPDGFMAMPELIEFIEAYARVVAAPVKTDTTVTSVRRTDDGYEIRTTDGEWQCRALVVATGACNLANVPACAEAIPPSIVQVTPMTYRGPAQLPEGGVLVVGASATGVQLAAELQRSGRQVTIAVGEHVRLPRMYRGRDIQFWMDASGLLDMRFDQVDDLVRARNVASPQLVGTPERVSLDLNALADLGVTLAGRLGGVRGTTAMFSGSFRNMCSLADLKMNRLLGTLDDWAMTTGRNAEFEPSHRFAPTRVAESPPIELNLAGGAIQSILWATGYKPDYSWLDMPQVIDRKGKLRHVGGVVDSPGMYLLGETFLRRRKSSFIHGAGDDAQDLSEHLAAYLAC